MRRPRAGPVTVFPLVRVGAVLLGGLAVAALGSCGEPIVAGAVRGDAQLVLALRWPTMPASVSTTTPTANAVFGASIDTVEVVVTRSNESTAADELLPFPAGQDGLRFTVNVPLEQRVETLYAYVQLRAAGSALYNASSIVVLRLGGVPTVPDLPLSYVGPGADAIGVVIAQRLGSVPVRGTLQFTAVAQGPLQGAVPSPIGWSVSDATLATISASGLLTAKQTPGTLRVRAFTPTGLIDSVSVSIVVAGVPVLAPFRTP